MKNPWVAISKPSSDLNVRLVDEKHPLKLFWGVDSKNRYSFAFEAEVGALPKKKSLPDLSGMELNVFHQGTCGKLVLLLQNNKDWEIFFALCLDLVRATSSLKDDLVASDIILRRLIRWQELLRKSRRQSLSEEEIKGLMGELLFLRQSLVPVFGLDDAVTSWRGPEDAPQDFALAEVAYEVKCQTGGSRRMVKISSADQLCPQLPVGYLIVYTLARQTSDDLEAISLNSLVAQIRADLVSASATVRDYFEDMLFMSGYVENEEYQKYLFSVVGLKSYRLVEGFPRICPQSLLPGIEFVSYSIALEACSKYEGAPPWWPLT